MRNTHRRRPHRSVAAIAAAAAMILLFLPSLLRADAAGLIGMARTLASQGKFAAASALLKKAGESDPDSVEADLVLADLFRDAGYRFLNNDLFAASLESYRRAVKKDPERFEARYRLGALLYDGGKFKEAAEIFTSLSEKPEAKGDPILERYVFVTGLYVKAIEKRERKKKLEESGEAAGEGEEEEEEPVRCDLCWNPIGETHWTLDDGRNICDTCFADAVNDDTVAAEIIGKVITALEESLGVTLKYRPVAHLVSGEEIARIAGKSLKGFDDVKPGELAGLYTPGEKKPTIYVLRGMPYFGTLGTMAHEMAHAWESENCPSGTALGIKEGFAEYAAYQALLFLGHEEEARRMFLQRGPYGTNFKRFEVLGRIVGTREVTALMQEGLR